MNIIKLMKQIESTILDQELGDLTFDAMMKRIKQRISKYTKHKLEQLLKEIERLQKQNLDMIERESNMHSTFIEGYVEGLDTAKYLIKKFFSR